MKQLWEKLFKDMHFVFIIIIVILITISSWGILMSLYRLFTGKI